MTRQHFEAIASAIASTQDVDPLSKFRLATEIAGVLKQFNPAFIHQVFIDACR